MDYTSHSIIYKIRKVVRYSRLFGISRTWMKVRAQYHMRREFNELPPRQMGVSDPGRSVGIIGCGTFAYANAAYFLKKKRGNVIKACMDVDINRAASLARDYGARYFTNDAEQLIDDPDIKLLYITSNHASHAEYAIKALSRGKSVHIEKPHVVNHSQLVRLCRAMRKSAGVVGLGFNRPYSPFGRILKKAVEVDGSMMVMNWFVAGHELPDDHWYFSEAEGGRVLGNLCHWTDFILQMVPRERRYPIQVIPARGKKSDTNIAVSFVFGDGSIAEITFSAMGHTFEGVRERFAIHCGDVIAYLDDFHSLTVHRLEQKRTYRGWTRNHGHSAAILGSYDAAHNQGDGTNCCNLEYVWETADLFLRTREALQLSSPVIASAFEPSVLDAGGIEEQDGAVAP